MRFDFVWGPAWGRPNSDVSSMNVMPRAPDRRSKVWYDGDMILLDGMAPILNDNAPIYDIHFVYEPGKMWDTESDTPGEPDFIGHGPPNIDELQAAIDEYIPTCDEIVFE